MYYKEQDMKAHLNKGLFSNYYLDVQLPGEDEFKIPLSNLEGVLKEIKKIWDKTHLSTLNEPQLRKHFLDKIFEILGWTIDVEPQTSSGESSKRPDYTLFQSQEDLRIARKSTQEDYFKHVLCIGEAKRWGRPLDRKLREEKDPSEVQIPSLQMSRYLWLTGVKWGILTDGKYWRLYERETSKRLDIFYEIDLESLIENGSLEKFKYFYLFFQKDAFPRFVEKVYKGSIDYAEAVGEELKENIYQALKFLSEGFLKTPGNNLQETDLKEIHDNSLILLYRLLFILYAEYRGLLPVGKKKLYTESYSLDNLKKEVAEKLDKNELIAATTHGYWNKLKELFEIINIGNSELGVPPYNGGLFDPDKYRFLEKHRLGDLYIVKAIDLLSRSKDRAYIDYGSLEIRHLGSIYEGLLEYKPRIAEEDIVPIKEKGKNVFIPLENAKNENKKIKEEDIVIKGEVYLATDKGERKATGSYYTPDYIVKYIVENTLSPLIEEKKKKISQEVQSLKEKIKNSRGYNRESYGKELKKIEGNVIDEILAIKVLDPAMGSGHFLVEATDFLAMELLKVLSGDPIEGLSKEILVTEPLESHRMNKEEEEDIRWARREVVERSIFGVDLNPLAVELAKLSLWLYTVAKNRPLSFLDHHLRCGNSLIGARLEDLEVLYKPKKSRVEVNPLTQEKQVPLFDESKFTKDISLLMGDYKTIEELPSDTVEQVKEKDRILRELVDTRRERYMKQADLWTSVFFGNEMEGKMYRDVIRHISGDEAQLTNEHANPYLKKAEDLTKEKRFFHWELEFPEVFFDEIGRKRDNPGFDVIIGNPPYGRVSELLLQRYVRIRYKTSEFKVDTYSLFGETAISLAHEGTIFSFIIPNTLSTNKTEQLLREMFISNGRFLRFLTFPRDVFDEAVVHSLVFVWKKDTKIDDSEFANILIDNYGDKSRAMSINTVVTQPGSQFLIFQDQKENEVFTRLRETSIPLGKLIDVRQCIKTGDDTRYILSKQTQQNHKPVFGGSNMERYVLTLPKSLFVNYGNWLACPRDPVIFEQEKIVFRETGSRIACAKDEDEYYLLSSVYSLVPYTKGNWPFSIDFFLAVLNSKLIDWVAKKVALESTSGSFSKLRIYQVEVLPIRLINFTSTKEERKKLLEKGKKLYESCVEKGDDKCVTGFVAHHLDAKPERSDVIHDLLAFLAEQMIEMNKKKQKEIKGFLEWLENQLKIQSDAKGNKGIETFNRRTQIKNYLGDYQKGDNHLSFKEFWNILENNKNKIQANLKSRELYENIQTEYEKSLSKLLPLKEKLRKTDWLIDQIVYKLYGLTEEEIKIVESNR